MHDVTFTCMGCEMRLLAEGVDAARRRGRARLLHAIDARLSRFRPDSELARLNADPRATVPASPLLRAAVGAALWAAERTDGLVDPTLLDALERHGYTRSLAGAPRADLAARARRGRRRARRGRRAARAPLARGARSTTRPARSRGRPACASTRAARPRASPPTPSRELLAGARRARRRLRRRPARRGRAGRAPFDVVVEHPLTRRAGRDAARRAAAASRRPGSRRRVWRAPGGGPRTTCSTRPPASPRGPG